MPNMYFTKRIIAKKNTTKIGRITHCDASKKVSPTTGRQKMDAHPSSPGPWIIVFHDNHGLRTPNEGINQRYLKNWADVADKICLGRT